MIGGFIEQQQVGRTHQCARQLQAHTPTTGEAIDRLIQLTGFETQTQNQGLSAGLCIMRTHIIKQCIGMAHAFAIIAGFGGSNLCLGGH